MSGKIFCHVLFSGLVFVSAAFSQTALSPPLTSHTALKAKLEELARSSKVMKLEVIGKSVEGRELFAAKFSRKHPIPQKDRKKPLVLVFAQQHGNEPSGKEAALQLCEEFARGMFDDLLKKVDVIIVPQMNPDGSERGVRRNANDQDLNRNHILLDQPEVAALHALFRRYFPEVTLDVHEYNDYVPGRLRTGWVRAYDEMLGAATNPNVSKALVRYSLETIMPGVGGYVRSQGFSFHRYLVGGPPERYRYRYSTTAINDGRNSLAIYHTLSFIVEGRRYGDLTTRLERRRAAQRAAILGLIRTVAENGKEILRLVQQEREALQKGAAAIPFIAPRSNYLHVAGVPLPLRIELIPQSVETDTVFRNFTPRLKVPFYLSRPVGYLIPRRLTEFIEILQRHGVRMLDTFPARQCLTETYRIQALSTYVSEEKTYLDVSVRSRFSLQTVDPGEYVYVPVAQPAGHYICLVLEPQSQNALIQYPQFYGLLQVGRDYPVLRALEWKE